MFCHRYPLSSWVNSLLFSDFIMNGCWILSNDFSILIQIFFGFPFYLVSVVNHINWFSNVKPTVCSWDKIPLQNYVKLFLYYAGYYWPIFSVDFFACKCMRDVGLFFSFFLFVMSLSSLGIRSNMAPPYSYNFPRRAKVSVTNDRSEMRMAKFLIGSEECYLLIWRVKRLGVTWTEFTFIQVIGSMKRKAERDFEFKKLWRNWQRFGSLTGTH